jgi:hypothetical protein
MNACYVMMGFKYPRELQEPNVGIDLESVVPQQMNDVLEAMLRWT